MHMIPILDYAHPFLFYSKHYSTFISSIFWKYFNALSFDCRCLTHDDWRYSSLIWTIWTIFWCVEIWWFNTLHALLQTMLFDICDSLKVKKDYITRITSNATRMIFAAHVYLHFSFATRIDAYKQLLLTNL